MFSKLLKRRAVTRAPVSPSVPDGTLVWAIGDVHGRYDLMVPLIDAIRADPAASAADRLTVIFLGDYIDRGPDSRAVVQHLATLSRDESIDWRFLKGNHEEAMLNFLDDPAEGSKWCEYGGDATLASYGLQVPSMRHKPEAWAHLSADLEHKLPAAERDFLESLELSVTVGDYFFSHAGARPGQPLEKQSAEDLMWIRRTFLDSDVEFERIVVHGHTPERVVYADHRRIGVDTKAYASGVLTAVRLSGRDRHILQSSVDGVAISRLEEGLSERPDARAV